MNHVAICLTERDQFRHGGMDWQALTNAAWRIYLFHTRGDWLNPPPPPADFGLHYLTQEAA